MSQLTPAVVTDTKVVLLNSDPLLDVLRVLIHGPEEYDKYDRFIEALMHLLANREPQATCAYCGQQYGMLARLGGRPSKCGRPRKYCSTECNVRAYQARA